MNKNSRNLDLFEDKIIMKSFPRNLKPDDSDGIMSRGLISTQKTCLNAGEIVSKLPHYAIETSLPVKYCKIACVQW